MHSKSFGGTLKWPLKGGSRLIEVTATAGLTVFSSPSFLTYVWGAQKNRLVTGPRSAVGNVSGYRCVSDCRSMGRKFDPGPVPYFCGD